MNFAFDMQSVIAVLSFVCGPRTIVSHIIMLRDFISLDSVTAYCGEKLLILLKQLVVIK